MLPPVTITIALNCDSASADVDPSTMAEPQTCERRRYGIRQGRFEGHRDSGFWMGEVDMRRVQRLPSKIGDMLPEYRIEVGGGGLTAPIRWIADDRVADVL